VTLDGFLSFRLLQKTVESVKSKELGSFGVTECDHTVHNANRVGLVAHYVLQVVDLGRLANFLQTKLAFKLAVSITAWRSAAARSPAASSGC